MVLGLMDLDAVASEAHGEALLEARNEADRL